VIQLAAKRAARLTDATSTANKVARLTAAVSGDIGSVTQRLA
jgi:hypothetical protein